jgi:hypothetical protein
VGRACNTNGKIEVEGERVHSIDLAQDMDQWRALVNKVMNLRIP